MSVNEAVRSTVAGLLCLTPSSSMSNAAAMPQPLLRKSRRSRPCNQGEVAARLARGLAARLAANSTHLPANGRQLMNLDARQDEH